MCDRFARLIALGGMILLRVLPGGLDDPPSSTALADGFGPALIRGCFTKARHRNSRSFSITADWSDKSPHCFMLSGRIIRSTSVVLALNSVIQVGCHPNRSAHWFKRVPRQSHCQSWNKHDSNVLVPSSQHRRKALTNLFSNLLFLNSILRSEIPAQGCTVKVIK